MKGSACEVYSAAWFSYSHYCWSRLLGAQGKPVWETTRDGKRVLEQGRQIGPADDPDLAIYELLDAYQSSVTAK